MSSSGRSYLALALLGLFSPGAVAQTAPAEPPQATREESAWIAAAASADVLRFGAAGAVYQIRLQVFGPDGEKTYESGARPGNLLEWPVRSAERAPLPEGTHFCVVTAHSLSGRVTRSVGLLEMHDGRPAWLPFDVERLRLWQRQLVASGVLTTRSALTEKMYLKVRADSEPLPAAALAHDGTDAALLTGSGGLSVRTGDYFAGRDVERLRVTPEGEVGIGVSDPQARLHVGGLIRTDEGIVFADGTVQTTAAPGATSRGVDDRGPVVTGGRADVVGPQGITSVRSFESGRLLIGNAVVDEGHLFDAQHVPSPSTSDVVMRVYNKASGGAKLRYVAGTGATSQLQLTDLAEFLSSISGNNAVGLQFNVRTAGTPNNEAQLAASTRMTIARSGNIGVGTTTPTTLLDVAGQVRATGGVVFADGSVQTSASALPTGTVLPFAGTTLPAGFLWCDGQSYPVTQYPALFTALQIGYGSPNPVSQITVTDFRVPDLRGRFVRGRDGMGNRGSAGNDLGQVAGDRTVASPGDPVGRQGNSGNAVGSLQEYQVGPHTHTYGYNVGIGGGGNGTEFTDNPSFSGNGRHTTVSNGGSESRPRNLYLNYIIKF